MTWKLAWMLKIYITCNLTVRFSKYKLYNKLLGSVILFRVIPSVTWIQLIYVYREREQIKGGGGGGGLHHSLSMTFLDKNLE